MPSEQLTIQSGCEHEGVDSKEFHVCSKCGLVLDNLYAFPGYPLYSILPSYTDVIRLKAVDRHLNAFLEKVGLETSLYPLQENMRMLKMQTQYKTINYALAVACILRDNDEARVKLQPYLPKGDGAWIRCMNCPPPNFFWWWMIYLLKNARELTSEEEQCFLVNISRFNSSEHHAFHQLIWCYGVDYHTPFDMELKWILYKYSRSVSKLKSHML